eukprot:gene49394-14284_t
MSRRGRAVAAAALCAGVADAVPQFTGGDYYSEAEQFGPRPFKEEITAVERNGITPNQFYDFSSASSHTGFERRNLSFIFLYRDTADPNDDLSLFWLNGIDETTTGVVQDRAQVVGRVTQFPQDPAIELSEVDEGNEVCWKADTAFQRPGGVNPSICAPNGQVGDRWSAAAPHIQFNFNYARRG